MSPKAKPKSMPPTSWSSCWHRSGVMLFISATVSSGSRTLVSSLTKTPVEAQHRRLPDRDVQVAGLAVDHRLQQLVDENRTHEPFLA